MNDEKRYDPKESILLAARTLFADQGFDGTTVRQICDLANANQALVSYYFGGKESLYRAVLDYFLPIPQQVEAVLADKNPRSSLEMIVRHTVRWRMEHPDIVRIAQREMMSKSVRLSSLLTKTMPLWEAVRSILEAGRRQGIFQFLSLDYALFLVMGALMYPGSYPLHDMLRTEGSLSEEVVFEETIQFIMRGLGSQHSVLNSLDEPYSLDEKI